MRHTNAQWRRRGVRVFSERAGFVLIALIFALAAQPPTAFAETRLLSKEPEAIAVTVYRDDLALITEVRRIDLPAGKSTVAFEGVSDRIIPETAILQEFGAITIERNFDFDLLSPGALFEKTVGETVTVTRTHPRTGRVTQTPARIVAASPATGVLLEIGGAVEAYRCTGLAERISVSGAPDNLRARPTLSLDVSAEAAGPQELIVSYLASGFGWRADYVLSLGDTSSASLIGWLTLTNGTSVGVDNAPTGVVAGNLHRLWETRSDVIEAPWLATLCWPHGTTKFGGLRQDTDMYDAPAPMAALPMARAMKASEEAAEDMIVVTGSRIAAREDLGDYKLYTTPEPTTLAAHQTKQVLFLQAPEVDVEKVYLYEVSAPYEFEDAPAPATVEYRIDNSLRGKLAQPLPAGSLLIKAPRSSGQDFLLGEDAISDLAVDLPFRVKAGSAIDVRMESTVVAESERARAAATTYTMSMRHLIANALAEPVTVEIVLGANLGAAIKIDRANRRLERGKALPTFRITLPPGGSETLSYRASWID